MNVFTIGFTRKSADRFCGLLRASGAKRVVDVRLNNVSQLAGFAKRDDLAFFLAEICGMEYIHMPELAPTKEMLDEYRKRGGDPATRICRKFRAEISTSIPPYGDNIPCVRRPGRSCAVRGREAP